MRQIYIVDAHIVQSNGVFTFLEGYPKTYDSNTYSGDVDKTRRRAEGDACDVWGAMSKRDDRLIQDVSCRNIFGAEIFHRSWGDFPEENNAEE